MNMVIVVLIVAAIAAVAGFIWINRNKPEVLDTVEEKIRTFKKP